VKLGPEVLLNMTESYSMFVGSGLIPVSPLHTLVKLVSVLHIVTVCRQVLSVAAGECWIEEDAFRTLCQRMRSMLPLINSVEFQCLAVVPVLKH